LQPDQKEASIIAAARWTFFPAAVGKIDRFPGAARAEKWAAAASNLLGFEAYAAWACRLNFDIGSET
jgi:hypothetical protein